MLHALLVCVDDIIPLAWSHMPIVIGVDDDLRWDDGRRMLLVPVLGEVCLIEYWKLWLFLAFCELPFFPCVFGSFEVFVLVDGVNVFVLELGFGSL